VPESTYVPPRKLSPIERPSSMAERTLEASEPAVEQCYESVSTYSNKIPLPKLDRPVFVHFDDGRLHEWQDTGVEM